MNKEEAIKKTEELEKQLAELKAIIEAPDTSELVFKPKDGEEYEFIANDGCFYTAEYWDEPIHRQRLKAGNVFRVGTAKNSAKYYIMNSEYDYWLPWSGQPKPKVLPKGLEFWNLNYGEWDDSGYKDPSLLDNRHVYRWKRSEQVEG